MRRLQTRSAVAHIRRLYAAAVSMSQSVRELRPQDVAFFLMLPVLMAVCVVAVLGQWAARKAGLL